VSPRKPKSQFTGALTVRLPKDVQDALRKRARDEERTVAGLIRLAIRQYLTEQS
jgi:predicted transcriptional regulator